MYKRQSSFVSTTLARPTRGGVHGGDSGGTRADVVFVTPDACFPGSRTAPCSPS